MDHPPGDNRHHHHHHHDDDPDDDDHVEEILRQFPQQRELDWQQQQQQQQQQYEQKYQYDGDEDIELSPQEIQKLRQQRKSDELRALWFGAIEVFIHQLLHVRGIYPKASFCQSRFFNSQCTVCRHPGVVLYISRALQVAVPSILQLPLAVPDQQEDVQQQQQHVIDEMWIEIYDQVKMIPYERHVLSFSDRFREIVSRWILSPDTGMEISDDEDSEEEREEVNNDDDDGDNRDIDYGDTLLFDVFERDLRDLICSVGTLRGVAKSPWPDSTSFRILLSTKPRTVAIGNTHDSDNVCMVVDTTTTSVDDALASATWFRASSPSGKEEEAKRRIVYSIPNTGCQFQYQPL